MRCGTGARRQREETPLMASWFFRVGGHVRRMPSLRHVAPRQRRQAPIRPTRPQAFRRRHAGWLDTAAKLDASVPGSGSVTETRWVGIFGSRESVSADAVLDYIANMSSGWGIVTGGGRGVDWLAVRAAMAMHVPIIVFPADWDRLGKSAGPIRNALVVKYSEFGRGFRRRGGTSRGTEGTAEMYRRAGKPVKVVSA